MKILNNFLRELDLESYFPTTETEALEFVNVDFCDLLYVANKIREKYCGNKVLLCGIVNAKSGRCSEDCKFCAQSAHYNTDISKYEILGVDDILSKAVVAERNGAKRFGIVISGKGIFRAEEKKIVIEAIKEIKKTTSLKVDASLGCISCEDAILLRKAGLDRYHHNLETSPRFFPRICTTHSFEDRLATLENVKKAGLELCTGGLFGLGESWEDRIKLAFIIKKYDPVSVPLNFLFPIPNTPLENANYLTPKEILKIIAIFRLILPENDISVCGGREYNLRDLQSWIFFAGANGFMVGDYLTTKGRSVEDDLQLLKDLDLCPEL